MSNQTTLLPAAASPRSGAETAGTCTAPQTGAPSFDETCAAIDQLNQSERGTKCLKRFVSMLRDYGMSLDTGNWKALETLHRAGACGQKHRILAILEARK